MTQNQYFIYHIRVKKEKEKEQCSVKCCRLKVVEYVSVWKYQTFQNEGLKHVYKKNNCK